MMTVNLHWEELHSPPAPGVTPPHRFATFNSLHEALEQAVADDGLTATRITSADDADVLASRDRIATYAKAKADLEAKREAAIQKAHDAHLTALFAAAGGDAQ